MEVLTHGSLANIYGSLDAYIENALGSLLTIRLHGVRRFVPPVDDPWVEVHYDFLGLQSEFRKQTGRWHDDKLIHATERQGNLQLNIYQRARYWATRYTTAAARDLVMGAFPEGYVMHVHDMAQKPDSQVGALIFDGSQEHVQDQGMQSGLIQHVVQIRTRYLEMFTR